MALKALPLLLCFGFLSPALGSDALYPDDSAKPGRMRHVITDEDHDAAVKAELARQQASAQAQAADAAKAARKRPLPKDAPVARSQPPPAKAQPSRKGTGKGHKPLVATKP